jgi:SAM-dependent methyltransferase
MTIVDVEDDLGNAPEDWDRRAETYLSEASACCWTEEGMRVRHDRIAEILAPRLRADDTVYDHGCGTGHLRDALLPRLRTGVFYVGWDRSSGMRARARELRPGIAVGPDPPPHADHIVACGPYNLSDGWDVGHTTQDLLELWERYHPRTLLVTLRTGSPMPGHLAYSPTWMASLAHAFTSTWEYDGVTLPHEAFLTLDGRGRR